MHSTAYRVPAVSLLTGAAEVYDRATLADAAASLDLADMLMDGRITSLRVTDDGFTVVPQGQGQRALTSPEQVRAFVAHSDFRAARAAAPTEAEFLADVRQRVRDVS
ncbi:hypothetical protein ACFVXQ_28925 [Kitasatospora sp. NPDC058263]